LSQAENFEPDSDDHPTSGHFMGTWAAIAVLSNSLVRSGLLTQEEIASTFENAAAACQCRGLKHRYDALAAVHTFVDRLADLPAKDRRAPEVEQPAKEPSAA
jgi:hypothetical protein